MINIQRTDGNDGAFYFYFDEIRHLSTKWEIHEYIKTRLRDAFGESEIFIDLKNIKNWYSDIVEIPIKFKNQCDKKSFLNLEKHFKDIIIQNEISPKEIPSKKYLDNSLSVDYVKIRELIPTQESIERQAFKDCLQYIKQYSFKKIKSKLNKIF